MATWKEAYRVLADTLAQQGINVEDVKKALKAQRIETPSWGYADSGTRFKVFRQAGAARTTFEKLADAAQVHKLHRRRPLGGAAHPLGQGGRLRRACRLMPSRWA